MGNQQKRKEAAIEKLEADVSNLDPNDLEYVGHALVTLIEGQPLVHRGLNRSGKPVGYTVDTFSSDRKTIAEYSATAGYFEKPFGKIAADARHALAQAPDCDKLYLISSSRCDESAWRRLPDVIKANFPEVARYEIYDSRRIATEIYERAVLSNTVAEHFADFLPSLWQLWTENVLSHALPPIPPDFIPDTPRADAVRRAIEEFGRVAIRDISGSGKTYTAIEYAHEATAAFENTIWLPADELVGVSSLTAVRIKRLGAEINLLSHLRTSACLLIIDDWQGSADKLRNLLPSDVHRGTRILVTCICGIGDAVAIVELPPLSRESAESILLLGMSEVPTTAERNIICQRAACHPLTLAIIRDTVRETGASWAEIVADLDNLPQYEGGDRQTILQRVLLNRSAGIADELQILRWLDVQVMDAQFVLHLLSPAGLGKILARSVLRKDARNMCKMHDLIFACVKHFTGGSLSVADITGRFLAFFAAHWETGSYHFSRSLQIHGDRIRLLIGADAKPGLETYLSLLIETPAAERALVEQLAAAEVLDFAQDRAASLSIVEAIERRSGYLIGDARTEALGEGLENISRGLGKANAVVMPDLLHHRGKLYGWMKQFAAAREDFERVLEIEPTAYHAHLQLARIKTTANDPTALEHLWTIVGAFENDATSVAITVVLAAFAQVARSSHKNARVKLLMRKIDVFRDAITLAVAEGFSQPYRTLARVARYFYYEHPHVLVELAKIVVFPPTQNITGGDAFDVGECFKTIGKARVELGAGPEILRQWCEEALLYYQRVGSLNEFQTTMVAECLILLEHFNPALGLLNTVDSPRSMHWWHRRAQAERGLGNYGHALQLIDTALKIAGPGQYAAAFLQAKAQIEADLGKPECISTMRAAITVAETKFRAALLAELRKLEAQFGPATA